MKKHRKLIIVGDSAFAQVAYEFFNCDIEYDVVDSSVYAKDKEMENFSNLLIVSF